MAGGPQFHYLDSTGQEFGPFPAETLRDWFAQGLFPVGGELPVRLPGWSRHVPLRLAYPDLQKAFVGPPAISSPDEAPAAPAYDGSAPPGEVASPYPGMPGGQMGQYWMMPQNQGGMMMPGMMGNPMMGNNMMMGGGGFGGMPQMGGAGGAGAMAGSGTPPAGRQQGRIKSFNAKQGFGFIECPEAHAFFGRDIFLHKAQIGDLKVGAEVTFMVENNKSGMPQARDILTLDGQTPGGGAVSGAGRGAGRGGRGPGRGGKGGNDRGGRGGKGGKGFNQDGED